MGKNCPHCSKDTQTSFPEQAIYYYTKKVFNDVINRYKDKYEIDIFIKDINVGIEYDGRFFHSSNKSKNTEIAKEEYFNNKGIKIFRIKEITKNVTNEKNNYYLYYEYDNGINLTNVLKKLFNKLKTDFKDIDVTRDYIEIQEQYISSVKANSILNSNPELCKEWNYKKNLNISPNNVTSGSKKKVWWVCPKCGYEWQVQIVNRNHRTNCPKCRKKDG